MTGEPKRSRRAAGRSAELAIANRPATYEAVRSGSVPCLRIGRHMRFTRAMLENWLQGRVA
jgi:excisionase family DNA binding protein